MLNSKVSLLAILMVLIGLVVTAKEKPQAAPPQVTISSPAGGLTTSRTMWVKGTISDRKITRATIVINGSANPFDVKNGQFQYFLVLAPGENTIQVLAENRAGLGRDSVVIFATVPKRDLKVVMTWDTRTDIDLHVIDPNGDECYYQKKRTKIGGRLDRDDTDGFGPETFLLSNAVNGRYVVKVKYYGGSKGQTRVTINAVLFEGTPREKREVYHRILTRAGEFAEVCSFSVER